jgi:pimeloyl-ACP methyl ester carboxylesterase
VNWKRAVRVPAAVTVLLVLGLASMVRPDLPLEELLPRYAGGASRFIDIDGRHIHYRDEGKGSPLLLLHGTSSSLHTWDGWVKALAGSRRIIRLDLPGYGLTGPAPDGDQTPARQARVLVELLERLGVARTDVAGNSLGGRVALTFALAYPERVRKLVLVDAAGMSGQQPPGIFRLAKVPVVSSILRWVTPRFLVRKNVEDVYGVDARIREDVVDRYHDMARRQGNRAAVIERFRAAPFPDLDDEVAAIRAPTLILWGGRDPWIPLSFGERLHRAMPGSRLIVYPDAGHMPMEELPEQSARDAAAFLGAP